MRTLVYDNPGQMHLRCELKQDEYRLMDVALAVLRGRLLTLVYMEIGDDVRIISFRNASREEHKQYEQDRRKFDVGE